MVHPLAGALGKVMSLLHTRVAAASTPPLDAAIARAPQIFCGKGSAKGTVNRPASLCVAAYDRPQT